MFKVTATTIGQGNPSHVGAGKPYKYRGDPDWVPGGGQYQEDRPAETLPQNREAIAGRKARLAEYARLRTEEGLTPELAAKQLGIGRSTKRTYEREFKAQQEPQP